MSEVEMLTLTEHDARRLTERIRLAALNYSEAKEKLLRLVHDAKEGAAHVALGYASWTAYLADVMSEEPLRLARDDRREVVQLLSDEGMSTRAIAPIVGKSHEIVARDIRSGVNNVDTSAPSAPAPVTGMDGKTYQRPEPRPAPERPRRSMAENLDDALSGLNLALSVGNPHTDLTPNQQNLLIEKLEAVITRIKGEQS